MLEIKPTPSQMLGTDCTTDLHLYLHIQIFDSLCDIGS
jgi:hypothetical protein